MNKLFVAWYNELYGVIFQTNSEEKSSLIGTACQMDETYLYH